MKKIAIIGSTGSIGKITLKVCEYFSNRLSVYGLASYKNIELLESQIKKYNPEAVAIVADKATELREKLFGCHTKIYSGMKGVEEITKAPDVDIVVLATVGSIGIIPAISAIKHSKDIALACKEVLAMAGRYIMELARNYGVKILPMDSEHSAIFQCLEGKDISTVTRIILTGSGGPFRDTPAAGMRYVTPKEAINHPRWSMGKKISCDSATLMNKGLEVIEAHHLFGIPPDKIKVVIHPESIIHSMIEFADGSILAQLAITDMWLPVAYALTYPERLPNELPLLNLVEVGSLTFYEPDTERFPCLDYAYESLKKGGTMPTVLNAANEVAVDAFLNGRIDFLEIPKLIREAMDKHLLIEEPELEQIITVDTLTRDFVRSLL